MGTVVIGGGTGFIGTALGNALRQKGYDVLIVSRKPGPCRVTWNDIVESGLPASAKVVVNLAGQNILDPMRRWTVGFKQNVWASRVNTTRYLAKAIRKAQNKPEVFVTMSGVGFYAPSDTEVYTEDSPGGNFDFLSQLCTDWEEAADLPDEPVRIVKIRSGVVLGREGGLIQQLIVPFSLGLGGPVGSGTQPMPWIHLKDIVGLIIHAIENRSVQGVVNGVAPEMITNNEFTSAFAKALWRPAFIPLPELVLNLLFSFERAKIMTQGQKVAPQKAVNTGYHFIHPDIRSASEEFAHLFHFK